MGHARIKREKATSLAFQPEPTPAQAAAAKALVAIHARSFSGRNSALGKMIKCQVCSHRHRESIIHKQVFAKRWIVVNGKKEYTKEELIAGKTPETESVIESRRVRLEIGASVFKGKRRRPPLNKRANIYVQLVRDLLPDEYTHEELEAARKKAKRLLAKKYGRHGFLSPIGQSHKEEHVEAITKAEAVDSTDAVQSSEAELPIS